MILTFASESLQPDAKIVPMCPVTVCADLGKTMRIHAPTDEPVETPSASGILQPSLKSLRSSFVVGAFVE